MFGLFAISFGLNELELELDEVEVGIGSEVNLGFESRGKYLLLFESCESNSFKGDFNFGEGD